MAGRPKGSENKDKPFRTALRMEIAASENDLPELRRIAKALIAKAADGDVQAIREIADRLDGKVPQAVVGDEEHPAIRLEEIRRVIVDPRANPIIATALDGPSTESPVAQ